MAASRALIVVAVVFTSVGFATTADAGVQAAAGRGFYVCSADTAGAAPTTYVSDIMPADGRPGPIQTAFREYLSSTYHERIPLPPLCTWWETQAQARQKRGSFAAGAKVVETNWTITGVTPAVAAAPAPAGAPVVASRAQTNLPTAASGQFVAFCTLTAPSSSVGSDRTFFTGTYAVADTKGNLYGSLFSQYLSKKYSTRGASAPSCTAVEPGRVNSEMQRVAGIMKANGNTVMMTDWTPEKNTALMAELANNPPAPAAASAPAPKPAPPSPAQDAFERAVAAQRPRSNTPPATPAPAPTSPAAEKVEYCSSTGSPYRGTAQSHFYVTQIFPASADTHLQDVFQRYLGQQHAQENVSSTSCPAGPRSTVEATRAREIDAARNNYKRAVVELDWKP